MNWYSQLTQLILSFYREDPPQYQQLDVLNHCKLSRRRGVFRIDCNNSETARAVIEASQLLSVPITQLRLAQEVKIMVKGEVIKTLPIDSFSSLLR